MPPGGVRAEPVVADVPMRNPRPCRGPVMSPAAGSTRTVEERADDDRRRHRRDPPARSSRFCDPIDVEDEGDVTTMPLRGRRRLPAPCSTIRPVKPSAELFSHVDTLVVIAADELVDDVAASSPATTCARCTPSPSWWRSTPRQRRVPDRGRSRSATTPTSCGPQLRDRVLTQPDHWWSSIDEVYDVYDASGAHRRLVVWAWIQEFWPTDDLDELPPNGSRTTRGARACRTDAAYTGRMRRVHPAGGLRQPSRRTSSTSRSPRRSTRSRISSIGTPEFVTIRENASAWTGRYRRTGTAAVVTARGRSRPPAELDERIRSTRVGDGVRRIAR